MAARQLFLFVRPNILPAVNAVCHSRGTQADEMAFRETRDHLGGPGDDVTRVVCVRRQSESLSQLVDGNFAHVKLLTKVESFVQQLHQLLGHAYTYA